MAQTKTLNVSKGTVTRTFDDGTGGQGCGNNTHLVTGRRGSGGTRRNYISYLQFSMDWAGVGRVVSAVLSLYTDTASLKTPKVYVRRLESSFTEGNNVDGNFDSSDYTSPKITTADQVQKYMSTVANGVTDIDITAMFKRWAPSSVVGGSGKTHYGIALVGPVGLDYDWSGWSEDASDASKRPKITLTYELGPTDPITPTDLSPVGAVASIGAFQGDFEDPRPEDTLERTQVQVFLQSSLKTGTASTDDVIHVTGHGLSVNQEVRFLSLTGGAGLSTDRIYYVRSSVAMTANAFKVSLTPGGTPIDITTAYSALTIGVPVYDQTKVASETERVNARSNVVPENLSLQIATNYQWRMRQRDQEARWSPWTALTTISVTNTNPDPPVPAPDGESYDSLNGVLFTGGTFTDDDSDALLAYQVQMSALPEGDPGWADASSLLWDTGKRYVATGSTEWSVPYGGGEVAAGTYYWRARHWDANDGVSDWAYASITLDADFEPLPGQQSSIQIDPNAPWRIRIREMNFDAASTGAVTGNAGTDVITTAKPHGFGNGRRIRLSALSGGAGLTVGTDYYVRDVASTTFKVAATLGGAAIDFTTNISSATVTAIIKRGPGRLLAVIEDSQSPGASLVYNSPGQAHWTLRPDHPQVGVIEPKQTHYGIDFYGGDGWRETFAGLVWDVDATDNDAVFDGIDYLALLDLTLDERYYPADPNRSYTKGGSYYAEKSIRTIVIDQLQQATIRTPNSPVGFITIGSIATMNETVTIWSTMQPTLAFVSGLLDSHRQGTGKRTRLEVRRTTAGAYQFVVTDDPGIVRDNLRMKYGELIQGYRIIAFGPAWASVINGIGRTREGIRVLYKTRSAPGIDQTVWGRIARAQIMDNVSDEHDLDRRVRQAAINASKLGSQMGLGIRTGVLQPLDGYDICDVIPVDINHGVVNTANYGSGYWAIMAVHWEGDAQGNSSTSLTLLPREDSTAPNPDIVDASPISPQKEWQIGWAPPDDESATAEHWLDQNTGIVYRRDDEINPVIPITGTAPSTLSAVGHGLTAGQRVYFANLIPADAGIEEGRVYYVLAAGLTADEFQVSETDGGAAFEFDLDIDEGGVTKTAVYTPIAPGEVMEPPPSRATPAVPALGSAVVASGSGPTSRSLVHMKVEL